MILIVYPTVPNVQLRRGGCGDSDIYTGVDSEAAIATGSFIRRSVLAFGTPRVAAYIAVAVTDGRRVSCPSLALPFLGRRAVTVAGRGPGARAVAPNVAPSVGIGPGSVAHTPGPGLPSQFSKIRFLIPKVGR